MAERAGASHTGVVGLPWAAAAQMCTSLLHLCWHTCRQPHQCHALRRTATHKALIPLQGCKAVWLQLFFHHLQVYKAVWQKSLVVAVKVMLQQQEEKPEKVKRDFLREIQLLCRYS